jgi:hypothetical protein
MIAAADRTKLTEPQREALAINHALALMTKGDFANAHAAIRDRNSLEAQWLILASALAANMRTDGLQLRAPTESYVDGAARWQSRIANKRFDDEGVRTDGEAVLPAMIFVIAHAAQVAGLNPELALDRMFEGKLPSRRFAFARAEAARWRKATDVANAHQARGELIEKLIVDDRAAVLAALAEVL